MSMRITAHFYTHSHYLLKPLRVLHIVAPWEMPGVSWSIVFSWTITFEICKVLEAGSGGWEIHFPKGIDRANSFVTVLPTLTPQLWPNSTLLLLPRVAALSPCPSLLAWNALSLLLCLSSSPPSSPGLILLPASYLLHFLWMPVTLAAHVFIQQVLIEPLVQKLSRLFPNFTCLSHLLNQHLHDWKRVPNLGCT